MADRTSSLALGRPAPRLLLVSDDQPTADLLARHLRRHGFDVSAATSAKGAAERLEDWWPDLVLIDAAIHGGWREVVRGLNAGFSRRRIAVLSAYWGTRAREEARLEGIGGLFLKELEGEDLPQRLVQLLTPESDGDLTSGQHTDGGLSRGEPPGRARAAPPIPRP
jgi:DNA-binding response OmpR family regulator